MNAIDWTKLEQESLARRTVRFDGGYVVRARERGYGAPSVCPPSEEAIRRLEDWFSRLFVRLARRLHYGGNKARNARKKLTRLWGSQGVPEAVAWCREHYASRT